MSGRAVANGPENDVGSTNGAGDDLFSARRRGPGARIASAGALVALAVAVVLSATGATARYSVVEALQYALFGLVIPPLVVIAAPWGAVGLGPLMERIEVRRHLGPPTSLFSVFTWLVPSLGVMVAWRIPAFVDAIARHRWLAIAEAATLIAAGLVIWLQLVASPPLSPKLSAPMRIPVAAVSMWTIWILAYMVGLSNTTAYAAYADLGNRAISVSADQQLTSGLLWFVAGCAYVPAVFVNLMEWLKTDSAAS